jgi:hypothetical protein
VERRLCGGVFYSVTELIETITDWAAHWNHHPKVSVWHKQPRKSSKSPTRTNDAVTSQTRDGPLE